MLTKIEELYNKLCTIPPAIAKKIGHISTPEEAQNTSLAFYFQLQAKNKEILGLIEDIKPLADHAYWSRRLEALQNNVPQNITFRNGEPIPTISSQCNLNEDTIKLALSNASQAIENKTAAAEALQKTYDVAALENIDAQSLGIDELNLDEFY